MTIERCKADPDEETGPETPLEPEVDSEARRKLDPVTNHFSGLEL